MAIALTDLDKSARYALQEDFDNGFLGRDRQIVIQTDDPKGYRPVIMDGKTSGGKNKVALLDDLEDWKPDNATKADSATKLATSRTFITNLASTTATGFNGTANNTHGVSGILPIAHGGTGNANGTVAKLTTARNLKVNLASTANDQFDGSGDATAIGVGGILPIANGGTGNRSGTIAWSKVTSKPAFATVATSGSYNDLTDKPDISGDIFSLTGEKVSFNKTAGYSYPSSISYIVETDCYLKLSGTAQPLNNVTGTFKLSVDGTILWTGYEHNFSYDIPLILLRKNSTITLTYNHQQKENSAISGEYYPADF